MKVRALWLEGYGCFSNRAVSLEEPALVVRAANDQEKVTLRSFVGDMLYGQKRAGGRRQYDASYALRRPWNNPQCYAGRMVYDLDDGTQFEVLRNFDKRREGVRIVDCRSGEDVTTAFAPLPNGEPSFAESHLGLTKSAFLNVATIGHMSLDHLGEQEALTRIRERLQALVDSALEAGPAEAAVERLQTRIAAIGQPGMPGPLGRARTRADALRKELDEAVNRRRALGRLEEQRTEVLEQLNTFRSKRAALDEELRGLERQQRADRLREAERLTARLDEVTEECFLNSSYRDLPLEADEELHRAAEAMEIARGRIDNLNEELSDLSNRLDEERGRLGPIASEKLLDVPEETEQRLAEIEARAGALRQRLETFDKERTTAEEQYAEAQERLRALPDFSRVAPDPVEWVNQFAFTFRMNVQMRDAERAKLQAIDRDIEVTTAEWAETATAFDGFEDFHAEVRELDTTGRENDEHCAALKKEAIQLARKIDASRGRALGSLLMGLLCGALAVAFAATAFFTGNHPVLIPCGLSALGVLWFMAHALFVHFMGQHREAQLEATEIQLAQLDEQTGELRGRIDAAMAEAQCSSIRELEALYERYTQARAKLDRLAAHRAEQAAVCQEEEEQTRQLLERLRETFGQLGVEIACETDVRSAAGRAIAQYQEYRDAKRAAAQARRSPARREDEESEIRMLLAQLQEEEVRLSLEVREVMRSSGFKDEAKHTSALTALRSYRIRNAQIRQKRGRMEVLQEQVEDIKNRIAREQAALDEHEAAITRILEAGGAESLEDWEVRARKAQAYRDLRQERTALQEQLEAILGQDDLDSLRAAVSSDGKAQSASGRTAELIEGEKSMLVQCIEQKSQEEYALRVEIEERLSGARPLNEVEEEWAQVDKQLRDLERELEAASYGAALVEEEARKAHARLAEGMGELAGSYLAAVTNGLYTELEVGDDLGIHLKIPDSVAADNAATRRLSRETIDQIYLALRLALARKFSPSQETIPVLLDDPFVNYDDVRLANTVRLLKEFGEASQVVVVTCRGDVVSAANEAGVPVVEIGVQAR